MFYVFNEFESADFVFSFTKFTKTEQLYRRIVSLSGNFIAGSKQRYTPLVSYYKSELWIGLKCRFICEAVFIQEADCVKGQIFLRFIKNYFFELRFINSPICNFELDILINPSTIGQLCELGAISVFGTLIKQLLEIQYIPVNLTQVIITTQSCEYCEVILQKPLLFASKKC